MLAVAAHRGRRSAVAREEWTLRVLGGVLAGILLLRLAGLGLYPLMDPSEARYAEIARRMLAHGDWLSPMFEDGVPLRGEPPLAFWAQALGMRLFGIGEFGARLSSWLFHVASALLIVRIGQRERSLAVGLVAAIAYSSCLLGLIASGAAHAEPALTFSLLLAFLGFRGGMLDADAMGARLGFVGLGLALLAKGPVALLLLLVPCIFWTAWNCQWIAFRALPWFSGGMLASAIVVPWHALAEMRSPGFLHGLLIGEHWRGAHAAPHGTVWLYLAGALLPWTLLLPLLFRGDWRTTSSRGYLSFLWVWALFTPLLFTMAGNVSWTCALSALPAWSLLLADGLARKKRPSALWATAMCAISLPLLFFLVVIDGGLLRRHENQKEVVATWTTWQARAPGPLFYIGSQSHAAEFYSAGHARHVHDVAQLPRGQRIYVVFRSFPMWLPPLLQQCKPLTQANRSLLLDCPALPDTQRSPLRHTNARAP